MKMATGDLRRNLASVAAALLVALGSSGIHGQTPQGGVPGAEKPAVSPLPEIVKPVQPSDLKSADAVFDELDAGGRGYVTRQDTKDLLGFGDAFQAADPLKSGRLTRAQFRKAWAIYRAGTR